MKVVLSKAQYQYLLEHVSREQREIWQLVEQSIGANDVVLTVGEEQADEIGDWAGERLQIVGFDKDDNPTPEGYMLEELIDVFYTG